MFQIKQLLKNLGVYFVFLLLFSTCYILVTSIVLSQLSIGNHATIFNVSKNTMPMVLIGKQLTSFVTWVICGILSTITALIYLRQTQTYDDETIKNPHQTKGGKMISIQIRYADGFEVNHDYNFGIAEIEQFIETENQHAKREGVLIFFEYALLNDGVDVYVGDCHLPSETPFDLFETILADVRTMDESTRKQFIPWLCKTFKRKPNKIPKTKQGKASIFTLTAQPKPSALSSKDVTPIETSRSSETSSLRTTFTEVIPDESTQLTAVSEQPQSIEPTIETIEKETLDYPQTDTQNDLLTQFQLAIETQNDRELLYLFEGHLATLGGLTNRLIAGYAYLRTGQINKALALSNELIDAEFTHDVLNFQMTNALIEARTKKLAELQSAPFENRAEITEIINEIVNYKTELQKIA